MEFVTFRDLSLSPEESRDIIEFIAQKRNVNNCKDKSDGELLSAIKAKSKNLTPKKPSKNLKRKKSEVVTLKKSLKNLKRKISEILTLKKSLKNPKRKISENLTPKKSLKNPKRKITENLTSKKSLKNPKRKITENLTPKKSLKNPKRKITENLTSKKSLKNPKRKISEYLTSKKSLKNPKCENNRILTSKNKERIDIIREELKDFSYKLLRSELKEIKKNLYNIEKRKFESKETIRYLDELDKKILKLDRYPQDYDDSEYKGVKDVRDLFKSSVNEEYYKLTLVKNGYDNNYTQYESKGDTILTI